MTRVPFLALFAACAVSISGGPTRADLPVAPAPRAVRPDGSRPPAPAPEPRAKAEDPAVILERIIKNSRTVESNLAAGDTGPDTVKLQEKILADIDALMNPPPPDHPKNDKNKDDKDKEKQKNKDEKEKQKPKDPDPTNPDMMPLPMKGMPMPGMQNPMPMPSPMPSPMPMGGDDTPKGGRRPRMGEPSGEEQKKEEKDPGGMDVKPTAGKTDKGEPKKVAGGGPTDKKTDDKTNPAPAPQLSYDDNQPAKSWGYHLEKIRKQMTLYSADERIRRYEKLVELYRAPDGGPTDPK